MAVAKRERMSAAEFEARFADGETRAELLRDEVILMSPATSLHGIYTMRVSLPIAQFVEEHALGVVCGAETGFVIQHADGAESVLAPDMAYIAAERIPDPLPEGFWRIRPTWWSKSVRAARANARSPKKPPYGWRQARGWCGM
jgi:hypothetical protein